MMIGKTINLIKLFSFPIIIYFVFFIVRVNGYQPAVEGELGDFITAFNFMFGGFVAYLVFIIISLTSLRTKNSGAIWWWLMSFLLILLAVDELFMIHEFVGHHFQIKDTFVLLFYAAMLAILLLFDLKNTFKKETFLFLALFAIFSVISLVSDYLFNEGVMSLFGREISYEQLAESLGALCLSAAIVTIILRLLINEFNHANEPTA